MLIGPLTYVGFAGCLALGASLGVSMIHSSRLGEDLYRERSEYAAKVAEAEHQQAEAEAKYRKLEQDRDAKMEVLRTSISEANDKLRAARTRSGISAQQLLDAERAYVALQGGRTSKDPAAACRIDAESATMFQQLHRETDDFAQLAAGQADSLATQLMLLQHYVRDVCHN